MYLLYICFDDSLVVYTVNLRVQNKLGKKKLGKCFFLYHSPGYFSRRHIDDIFSYFFPENRF